MAHFNMVKDMEDTMKKIDEKKKSEQEDREIQALQAQIALYDKKIAEIDLQSDELNVEYRAALDHHKNLMEW